MAERFVVERNGMGMGMGWVEWEGVVGWNGVGIVARVGRTHGHGHGHGHDRNWEGGGDGRGIADTLGAR